MEKTACIFGSTGLVGSNLLRILSSSKRYKKVIVFNRSQQQLANPVVEQIVGDYSSLEKYADQLKADEYYCCLGTTIKKAGSKEAFEFVDFHLPVNIIKLAKKNNTSKVFVVSSIGASSKSSNFYLRVKGKMEEEILKTQVESLFVLRPSMLLGNRSESRFGESMGKIIMKIFGFIFVGKLKKYKAIEAEIVAN